MPLFSKRRSRSSISKSSGDASNESASKDSHKSPPTSFDHAYTQNHAKGVLAEIPRKVRNVSPTSPSSSHETSNKSAYASSSGTNSKSFNKSTKTRPVLPKNISTESKPSTFKKTPVVSPTFDFSRTSVSTSFDSSRGSSNGTMSFGSSRGHDSFVNVSMTGLSIDNTASLHSHYSHDPYTGRHEERNINGRIKQNGNGGGGGGGGGITTNRYLQPKTTSRHLPYLNINSTKTKALIQGPLPPQQQYPFNIRDKLNIISPVSTETSATDPCTPISVGDEHHNEFPDIQNNATPLFNVPLHPPPRPNSKRTNQQYAHSYEISSSASSSIYSEGQKQLAKANKVRHAALAEREYWKKLLRSAVIESGAESMDTARVLFNLGSALLRCKVRVDSNALDFFISHSLSHIHLKGL